MSVRLRLQRFGARKRPFYRIVAADQRSPRDGRYRELLGTYDPMNEPNVVDIKMDRVEYWLGVGAQPTERVSAVLRAYGEGKYISNAAFTESNKARLAASREAALSAKAVEPPKPKVEAAPAVEAEAPAAEPEPEPASEAAAETDEA